MGIDSIGFVGTGAITAALVRGLNRHLDRAPRVYLSPRGERTAAMLDREFGNVSVCGSNDAVLAATPIVVVAVRSADAPDVLRELRFTESHVVISVVAGMSLATLAAAAAPASRVVRAIPLPWVAQGAGSTPIHPADPDAEELFNQVGDVIVTDSEAALEALSAASATVAAHLEQLQTITDWLAAQDVAPELAVRYVTQNFGRLGGSLLDLDGAPDALGELARHHTTPGGLNEQFRAGLRVAGVPNATRRGLDALLARVRAG